MVNNKNGNYLQFMFFEFIFLEYYAILNWEVSKMYKVFKRVMSFILALILFIICLPLGIVVAIAIKLESKGSFFFKQLRTGKDGKEFYCYKFRSMVSGNDVRDLSKKDQVTKVGKFIRKTSIDELPQLINILKGEMTFIGPRPWITDYAKHYTKRQRKRLDVTPGMTGLAQCSGRNNISIKEKIDLDIKYVENMSLKMDLYIIFKTIICVLKKEGFSSDKNTINEEIEELKAQA